MPFVALYQLIFSFPLGIFQPVRSLPLKRLEDLADAMLIRTKRSEEGSILSGVIMGYYVSN